jgi:hypothetical protein
MGLHKQMAQVAALLIGGLAVTGIVVAASGRPPEPPGANYQTRAAEPPKEEQKDKGAKGAAAPKETPPPDSAAERVYVVVAELVEARADHPKEVHRLPKLTIDAGQRVPVRIPDGPQNLLAKAVEAEQIEIGTHFQVRVTPLGPNKARLFCSFQRNEMDAANVNEIRVLGHSVQAIQDVELGKAVRVTLQKDASGEARRWLEITVDEMPGGGVSPPLRTRQQSP